MPAQTLFSRRWLPMRKGARIGALRHTPATLALEDGQPPHAVAAAMLGQASVATTLRLYAHASTEALVDAIDARFGPRLRVLPEAVLDQYWTRKVEIGATATESECRDKGIEPSSACSRRSVEALIEVERAAMKRHMMPYGARDIGPVLAECLHAPIEPPDSPSGR